jgi:hypothetical protein
MKSLLSKPYLHNRILAAKWDSAEPEEQRLLNQAQRARCSRYTLARLNKPNRFLFELERVPRPRRLNHRYLLH